MTPSFILSLLFVLILHSQCLGAFNSLAMSANNCLSVHDSTPSVSGNDRRVGLLSNIQNISAAQFYSVNMDLKDAAMMVKNTRYMYEAAEKDAVVNGLNVDTYLKNVYNNMSEALALNELYGREEFMEALTSSIKAKGKLVCVLGGESTGKSLALQTLKKNSTDVVLVDLRANSDILSGLIKVLKDENEFKKTFKSLSLTSFMKIFKIEIKLPEKSSNLGFTFTLGGSEREQRELVDIEVLSELLSSLAADAKGQLTIVIDEANLALTINDWTSKIERVRDTLAVFTMLTKQTKQLNIVLVSSEHSFPIRLSDKRLAFNENNISKFIFAGEISPMCMFKLLTQKWGMGDNLASALISQFGGHIWDISLAVEELAVVKKQKVYLSATLTSRVDACIDACSIDDDKAVMREMLRELAEKGFVAIPKRNDRFAEIMSKNNVGGVVRFDGAAVGLPNDVWSDEIEYGIVPSKHSMRLAIAKVLERSSS